MWTEWNEHEGNLGSDRNTVCINRGIGYGYIYISIYTCQNSSVHFTLDKRTLIKNVQLTEDNAKTSLPSLTPNVRLLQAEEGLGLCSGPIVENKATNPETSCSKQREFVMKNTIWPHKQPH